MPSSWNVYYVVFLSAGVALAIPGLLALVSAGVSRLSRSSSPQPKAVRSEVFEESPVENQVSLGKRTNVRFFLGMNVALLLVSSALLLIPIVGVFKSGAGATVGVRAAFTLFTISIFAALGLFYAVRKGDVAWLMTYRSPRGPR